MADFLKSTQLASDRECEESPLGFWSFHKCLFWPQHHVQFLVFFLIQPTEEISYTVQIEAEQKKG